MRIAVAGGGPAGLLFALLTKRRLPAHRVTVFEQNPADATFGFGVVFSRGALEFLSRDEPRMHAELLRIMESWPMQRIVHRDQAVDIDGNGFSAIGRLRLLQLLQAQCRDAGVEMRFGAPVDPDRLPEADLVVAADGVNSALRRRFAADFRPRIEWLTNKFAWYGTRQVFECLTLTFREGPHGAFVAHHYRYAPDMSTFLVECEASTWHRAGLDRMTDEESRRYCEAVFAMDLGGHALIDNKSIWRNFPLLRNDRWSAGKVVLMGDALRTGHFSIGSGTRLAFDDAIALSRAIEHAGEDVPAALAEYERQRRPVVEKLVAAANLSSYWYERLEDKMALEPWRLAYDYMTRSGRMSDERLRAEAPRFMGLVDGRREGAVAREAANAAGQLAMAPAARELAARVASGLAGFGLGRGSRVLCLLAPSDERSAAVAGAMRAGFVPVLAAASSAQDAAQRLGESGAEVAIVGAELLAGLRSADLAPTRLRHIVLVGPADKAIPEGLFSTHAWREWTSGQAPASSAAATAVDDDALWVYDEGVRRFSHGEVIRGEARTYL